jgi:iron complex transport system substrate-binding protein
MREVNDITGKIVDAAVRIHSELGPGLLESVYGVLLYHDLLGRGLRVEKQKWVTFKHRGIRFKKGFRIDLLVEDSVVVEVKSCESIARVHEKQVNTYLKIMQLRIGLLLNFGAPLMKYGIRRIING